MDTKPRSFDPGSAFMDGKLYLFTETGVLVVRAWPDPRAWRLDREGPWKGARPLGLNMKAPDLLRSGSNHWLRCQARAFAGIPVHLRRAAARFGHRAWPLHVLFTRAPGALDLAERCPALALGLAFANKLRSPVRQPLRSARAQLRDPGPRTARRVAAWLGFEPSRAMVRVLGMLAPRDCSVGTLRLLREAMADPVLRKVLLHAPVLSEPLLGLLWDLAEPGCRLRLGSAVLSAVANADVDDGWHLLGCLGYLQQVWPDLWPGRPMPRLVSTAQLLRLHHQAHEERVSPIRLRALAAGLGGFPAPPLPDGVVQGFRFVPLRSADDLIQEGERMGHCVGSIDYVIDCARGHGFGYRVQAEQAELRVAPGQRATVWINREDGPRWEIGELRARSNHSPLPPLRQAVERWIALQDEPRLMLRARIPDAAIGRTLRVVRHRRPAPFARCLQPPRPPEAQGWQLSLGFDVPF